MAELKAIVSRDFSDAERHQFAIPDSIASPSAPNLRNAAAN